MQSRVNISAAFDQAASLYPDQVAIQYEDTHFWTYNELSQQVLNRTSTLQSLVPPGTPVCVLQPRSPSQVVTILAVAKIGAVYVPIDPSLSTARIEKIRDSLPNALFVTVPEYETLIPASGRWITLDTHPSSPPEPYRDSRLRSSRSDPLPDDIAAILFTSGSTGTPKGVQLTHDNLILPTSMLAKLEEVGPHSRVLQFSQPAFDMHLVDILTALLHGATLLQVSQEKMMTDIGQWIRRTQADTIHLTPSTISMLKPTETPTLKSMVTCGEPVTQQIISTWGPRVNLLNLYGPCEASSIVCKTLKPGDNPAIVGRQSPHAHVLISDSSGRVVPTGVAGDIVVRGGSVCRGYCNVDGSSKFLDCLYQGGQTLKGPWYCTGDYGYLTGAGELHLLGRRDNQVKINGQRAELGEVETVLRHHVAQAVVRLYKTQGVDRLVAFISGGPETRHSHGGDIEIDETAKPTVDKILRDCRDRLPTFMVPRVIPLRGLPLSASGKIDGQRLDSFFSSYHQNRNTLLPARQGEEDMSLQERILGIVRNQLQQDQISITDNLFEWGLTSMDMMRLLGRFREETGHHVAFHQMTQSPTVEKITEKCELVGSTPDGTCTGSSSENELSMGQESMLDACQVFGNEAYICPMAAHIDSSLDPDVFVQSVETVFARHSVFNTTFSVAGPERGYHGEKGRGKATTIRHDPSQFRGRVTRVPFNQIPILKGGNDENDEKVMADRILNKEVSRNSGWDVSVESPVRCTLYETSSKQESCDWPWLVVFKFHHLIIDEYSLRQVWLEVQDLYCRQVADTSSLSTALCNIPRPGYSQFASSHRRQATSRRETDRQWWIQQGKRHMGLEPWLVDENYSPLTSSTDSRFVRRDIPSGCFTKLASIANTGRNGPTTSFGIWLAITELFLWHYNNKRDFLLGVPTSHRASHPEFLRTMGYCVSLAGVPVSLGRDQDQIANETTLSDHIHCRFASFWECVAHEQRVEDVMQWLSLARGESSRPVEMNAQFVFHDVLPDDEEQQEAENRLDQEGFRACQLELPSRGSHYALVLHVHNDGDGAKLSLEYQTDVIDDKTAEEMADTFIQMVHRISADGGSISTRELLTFLDDCQKTQVETRSRDRKSVSEISPASPSPIPQKQERTRQSDYYDKLAHCWADVLSLDVQRLDPERSFFRLGGDSISAIRLCAKIRALGIPECKVSDLYANPTLTALWDKLRDSLGESVAAEDEKDATEMEEQRGHIPHAFSSSSSYFEPNSSGATTPTSAASSIEAQEQREDELRLQPTVKNAIASIGVPISHVEDAYAPTQVEMSMLLQSQQSPGIYISQILFHLEGSLDQQKLKDAWNKVVRAHGSLRTRYISVDSIDTPYVAVVSIAEATSPPEFEHFDASHLTGQELEQLLKDDREKGFEAHSEQMHRMLLIKQSSNVHSLVLTCHHAIMDGWSLGIVMSDLVKGYQGVCVPPGPSFASVLRRRQNDQAREMSSSSAQFWRETLRRAEAPSLYESTIYDSSSSSLDIGSGQQPRDIHVIETSLSHSSERLAEAANRLQVTPSVICLAALASALPRCTRPDNTKKALWVTTSGRGLVHDDMEVVGNLLRTIPVAVDVGHDADWLRRIQSSLQQGQDHSQVPASDIMKSFDKTHTATSINALLVYENHHGAQVTDMDKYTKLTSIEGREYSDVPFTLVVEPNQNDNRQQQNETKLTVKFDRNLISAGTARRTLDHILASIEHLCHEEPVHSLRSLEELEIHHEEKTWALAQAHILDQDTYQGGDETLVSLFQSSVDRFPQRIALSNGSLHLTYEQLDVLSDKVAHRLGHLTTGGASGVIVALLLEKDISMIVAMLGVLKSGAAYCPLEVDAPRHRLDLLIRRVNASAVISCRDGFDRLGHDAVLGIETMDIDTLLLSNVHHSHGTTKDLPRVDSDATCYTMFTSGSTGEPKACVLSHGSVAHSVQKATSLYGLQPSSRVLLVANYIFDASVTDIYGSLSRGACLVLLPDESLKTEDLAYLVNRHRISWMHLTPTRMSLVEQQHDMPTLRTIILGGEPTPCSLRDGWQGRMNSLVSAYGPTEAAVQVLASRAHVDSQACVYYETIPGNLVVLVNSAGQLCYSDEPGEILISGPQVFGGYHHDRRATEGALVRLAPFGNRLFYRTGDMAEWRPKVGQTSEMEIRILGRRDERLKVSGMRISPSEIEEPLNAHPAVGRCSVFQHGDRLFAAFEAAESHTGHHGRQLENQLHDYSMSHLPGRLVPVLKRVRSIPLLPSMKVDKKRLRAMMDGENENKHVSLATKSASRTALYTVASAVGTITGSSVDSSDGEMPLTMAGLDSLGFLRLRALLSKEHDVSVSYSQLRKAATLTGVAALLPQQGNAEAVSSDSSDVNNDDNSQGQRRSPSGRFPLLPSQRLMWLGQQRRKDQSYHVKRLVQMPQVSGGKLLSALLVAANNFDPFRTSFSLEHGQMQQHIRDRSLFSVQYLPLPGDSCQGDIELIRQFLEERERDDAFELDSGRDQSGSHVLARFTVFESPKGHGYLFSNIHHILVDGYTSQILADDICKILTNNGEPLSSPQENTGTLALETEHDNTRNLEANTALLQRWSEYMHMSTPFLPPPTLSTSTSKSRYSCISRSFMVDTGRPLPPFHVLLAVFQLIMHIYTSSGDVVITTPISSRGVNPCSMSVLGNLTATTLVRSRLDSDGLDVEEGEANKTTFSQFAQHTSDGLSLALDSAHLPIDRICAASGVDLRDHEVMFSFADNRRYDNNGPNSEVQMFDRTWDLLSDAERPMRDLSWHVFAQGGGRLHVRVDFDTAKHDETTIEMLADAYTKLLGRYPQLQDDPVGVLVKQSGLSSLSTSSAEGGYKSRPSKTPAAHPDISVRNKDTETIRRDDLEEVLCRCAAETLSLPNVDAGENLGDIGMDSFMSMAFISAMYGTRPDIDMGISDVFESRTIACLAKRLATNSHDPEESPQSDDDDDDDDDPKGHDDKVLIAHTTSSSMLKESEVIPETHTHSYSYLVDILLGSIADVLGCSKSEIDPDENFTALGIDSFGSMSFISNIYGADPSLDIGLHDLIQHATINSLARHLLSQRSEEGGQEGEGEEDGHGQQDPVSMKHDQGRDESIRQLPASSIQKRFFLLQEQLEDNTYSLPSLYRVTSDVPLVKLLEAVRSIVEAHDIFRTTFHLNDNDDLFQVIHPSMDFKYQLHNIEEEKTVDPGDETMRMQAICQDEARRPFDLESGESLIRFHGFQLSNQDRYLFLNLHHAIGDQQSVARLLEEVTNAIRQQVGSRQDNGKGKQKATSVHGSYAEFSRRQNEAIHGGRGKVAAKFWKSCIPASMNGRSWSSAPEKRGSSHPGQMQPNPSANSSSPLGRATTVRQAWDFDIDPLQRVAKAAGVTSFSACLFLFQSFLSWNKKRMDNGSECEAKSNCVLIPASCRSARLGADHRTYGSFVNTLPIGLNMEKSEDMDMLLLLRLEAFAASVAKCLDFGDMPFESIMDATGRSLAEFDTMLVYGEVPGPGRNREARVLKGVPELMPSLNTTAKFPITFFLSKRQLNNSSGNTQIRVDVEYNPDQFTRNDVERACTLLEKMLRLVSSTPLDTLTLQALERAVFDSSNNTTLSTNHSPRRDSKKASAEKKEAKKQKEDEEEEGQVIPVDFHGVEDPSIARRPLVDEQIMRQFIKSPDSTAVIFEQSATATYGQLARMVCHAAKTIIATLPPSRIQGQVIAIVGDVSIQRVAVLIAVLALGACYVPLDFKNPDDWNEHIIRDCEPVCVLFLGDQHEEMSRSSSLMARLKSLGGEGPCCIEVPRFQQSTIQDDGYQLPREFPHPPNPRSPDDIAYILYTSGSTGVPKGVPIDHHGLRNTVHEHQRIFGQSSATRVLGIAPWTFDVSVVDTYAPLSLGASLVVGRREWVLSDPETAISAHRVTHIATTPTVASILQPENVPTLKTLGIGGEPMTAAVRDLWARGNNDTTSARLLNVYGPTEAAVDVITREVLPDTVVANIGHPLRNVFVYILDEELRQVGVGVSGQLALGGPQIAPRGYLRLPTAANGSSSKPSPFITHDKYGKIYLTGDMAKFDDDGTIICQGRIDSMVNLRGQRVELGAVEQLADSILLPQGGKSVTLKLKRGSIEALVALFTVHKGQDEQGKEVTMRTIPRSKASSNCVAKLRQGIRQKLPPYFMPTYWIPVTGFPRNANNKLDRKKVQSFLDELDMCELDDDQSFSDVEDTSDDSHIDDAGSSLEDSKVDENHVKDVEDARTNLPAIMQSFRTVLGGGKAVQEESNFFVLGGDSISVIRLARALRRLDDFSTLRVREIYDKPTPRALADSVQKLPLQGLSQEAVAATDAVAGTVNSSSSVEEYDAERIVRDAFAKTLGNQGKQLRRTSNFFVEGGDSISVIRLARSLRSAGATNLRVREIYDNPTVEALANRLLPQEQTHYESRESLVETTRVKNSGLEVPLTPVMSWFLHSGRANINWFNQGQMIRLKPGVPFDRLRSAWNTIIHRHPALRMRLGQSDHGKPEAIFIPEFRQDDFLVRRQNYSCSEEVIQGARDLQASLNLTHGPISAVGEFKVSDGKQNFTICPLIVHHMAVDVVSWHIILDDLDDLLQGRDILPELSHFQDWALHLHQRAQNMSSPSSNVALDNCIQNQFVKDKTLTDSMRQLNTNASAKFVNIKIPCHVAQASELYKDAQPVDLILTALVAALSRWSQSSAVELCFESHGRDIQHRTIDVTRTVGWFTYMFPVGFRLPRRDNVSPADMVDLVKESRSNQMDHDVDFARYLRTTTAPEGSQSATFNFLGQSSSSSSFKSFSHASGLDAGGFEDPDNARPFVLDFEASLSQGYVNVGVIYSTNLHSESEALHLLKGWGDMLTHLAQGKEREISFAIPGSLHHNTGSPATPHHQIHLHESMSAHREAIMSSLHSQKIQLDTVEGVAPATQMQASMLISSIGSRLYMHSYDYSIDVDDVDAWCSAWDEVLARRHSIFRTIMVPLVKVPRKAFGTNLFQVILTKNHARGKLVHNLTRDSGQQPPERIKASFGSTLSHFYVYNSTTSGKLRARWFCHHALIDAWSRSIVFSEVKKLYQGLTLAPVTTQFSDIVSHTYAQKEQLGRFWVDYLRGVEPCHISEHHSVEAKQTLQDSPLHHQHRIRFPVDPARLESLATRLHTTVPTLYKAAWGLVLSSYLASHDVTFGCVAACRASDVEGIDNVVGPCLNTVPTRVGVDWNQSIKSYIRRLSDDTADVAEHENMPLAQIYEASGTRDLFNTTLVLPAGQSTAKAAAANERKKKNEDATKPKLNMELQDRDEVTDVPILISVVYGVSVPHTLSIDLRSYGRNFTDDFLIGLVKSYGHCLEDFASLAVADASQDLLPLHEKISVVSREQQDTIMGTLVHGSEYPADLDLTCWQLFDKQAKKLGPKTAVEFHTRRDSSYATSSNPGNKAGNKTQTSNSMRTANLSYTQLHQIAESGAMHLIKAMGTALLPKESRVALFMDKSLELIASMLAVTRIDCVYTPIDIESPSERIRILLNENRPAVILCPRNLQARLPEKLVTRSQVSSSSTTTRVLFTEDVFPTLHSPLATTNSTALSSSTSTLPNPTARPSSPAAILFTSGTTGSPKGVVLPHRLIVGASYVVGIQALGYRREEEEGEEQERVFGFARPGFDISQSDCFGTFLAGGTLVLTTHEEAVAGVPRGILRELGCTSVNVTSSVAGLIPPSLNGDGEGSSSGLRSLAIAGEKASKKVVERYGGSGMGSKTMATRLVNAYGPCEGHVVSWKHVDGPDVDPGNIGRPSCGMSVYLLDEHMRLVPRGGRGTLWIAGHQLSLGYFGREEATNKVFRENPFGEGMIYNTGDGAAYDSDGDIIYLGRLDRQVKIHGRRVELGEIENTLSTQTMSVAVLILSRKTGGPQELVAFYLDKNVDSDSRKGVSELEQEAVKSLPAFMRPKVFIPVDEIPLTGNGKLDQSCLKRVYDNFKGGGPQDIPTKGVSSSITPSSLPTTALSSRDTTKPRENKNDKTSPLLNLTDPDPSKPNIFFFGSLAGISLQYRSLVPMLPSYNVIGIDNPRLNLEKNAEEAEEELYPTLPSMASEHATLIRQRQLRGPYRLAGFSFAGHVAWVTAQKLREDLAADTNSGDDEENMVSLTIIDAEATYRSPVGDISAIEDVVWERNFGIPPAPAPPKRGSNNNNAAKKLIQMREAMLRMTRHNLRIMNGYMPTSIFDGDDDKKEGGDLSRGKVLVLKRCCRLHPTDDHHDGSQLQESSRSGVAAAASSSHGGECARANGFDMFVGSQGSVETVCVPAEDHYSLMKEPGALRVIGDAIEARLSLS